jgi:hypothetical protein
MENEGRIQVFVAQNAGKADASEIYRFWCACQIAHIELAQDSQYTGWYADMMLQNFGKELLDGFLLQDKQGNDLLTYSLWTHREFADTLLLYQAMGNDHILSVFQKSEQDNLISQLEKIKQEYVREGTVAKPLAYDRFCHQ